MSFLTDITCVWGRRGSGKTTLAKDLVAKAKPPQLVIIDPLSAEGVDHEELADRLFQRERLTVCNENAKEDQLKALYTAFLISTPARPVYVICDEAPGYLDAITTALNKVVLQGRHAGFGMCLVGQRPAAVAAQIRSQAASTYWMALSDHIDVSTAAKSMGTDRAQTLQSFNPGQFIKWPE